MMGKGVQTRILHASDQIHEGDLLTTDKDSRPLGFAALIMTSPITLREWPIPESRDL
jgi:hypothetical protein